MNSEAERTLNNLYVLSAVSQNDKLMTNGDEFDIYTPTTLRALMRTWYGECRAQNVQRARHNVRAAMTYALQLLEDGTERDDASESSRARTLALQRMRLLEGLRTSVRGLTNLLQTYRDDAALVAQIAGLIQEIHDYLSVYASSAPSSPRFPPHSAPLQGSLPSPLSSSPHSETPRAGWSGGSSY